MRRVFEIDVPCCPRCEATPMRILSRFRWRGLVERVASVSR